MKPQPTVLDRLQVAGLKPELVTLFRAARDEHKRRQPCRCSLCEARRREVEGRDE